MGFFRQYQRLNQAPSCSHSRSTCRACFSLTLSAGGTLRIGALRSARSSRGAMYQQSRVLTSLSFHGVSAERTSQIRHRRDCWCTAPRGCGLLIVEVFGIPSAEVPTEIPQFSHLRSRGVVASRHSPIVCRRVRELQDDKLPCHR